MNHDSATSFERRVPTYFHLTSWPAESVQLNKPYPTPNETSHYWASYGTAESLMARMLPEWNTPEKLAVLGRLGLTPEQVARSKGGSQAAKERVFEDVRATEFPHAPSRLRCMFVCESEKQLRDYMARYDFPTAGRTLVEVEMVTFSEPLTDEQITGWMSRAQFDARNETRRARVNPRFLDCNSTSAEQAAMARRYWSGDDTGPDALSEVLFEGFFRFLRIVETWPTIATPDDAARARI